MPPNTREKRYLTGIDWVVNALDTMSKHAGGRGNSSQIILELEENIPPVRLRELLDRVAEALPVLGGRVARDWNLCPYWKFGNAAQTRIPLTVLRTGAEDPCEEEFALHRHVNSPFTASGEHLRFCLINRCSGTSLLGMHFDHRLLDAFGAETFLELLARFGTGRGEEVVDSIRLTEPPHLDNWGRRFIGGRNTNRMQLRLSRDGMASLPVHPSVNPRDTHFELLTFTPEQTRRIKDNLSAGAGFMLALPAMLSCMIPPLHKLMQKRGCSGPHYVIPVSLVRRTPEEIWGKLFFNHVSFIFFQIPARLAGSRQELALNLQNQLYERIKEGLPDDIYHACMLTRIAPLPLMRIFSRIPVGGRVATSYFACLKEPGFKSRRFLGTGVRNLIHTPHVPIPPGLGFFLNFFNGRLNLVVSHIDGLLQDGEARQLVSGMKKELLE